MIDLLASRRRLLLSSIGGNDANTMLLLHMDGADAATVFTDVSTGGAGSPHTMTANGNAQVDTAQSVLGGASLLLDGSGDYLHSADSADWAFGSGDFTLDFRIRFATVSSIFPGLVSHYHGSSNKSFLLQWVSGTNVLRFAYTTNGSTDKVKDFAWAPSANTWYHVAVVRDGSNLRAFVDGTQIGSTLSVSTDSLFNSTGQLQIGAYDSGTGPLNGWLDEVRVSNSARWTANFTPPAGPYD